MSGSPREEELGRGQRGQEDPQGHQKAGDAPAGLIVWVVTRRVGHETAILGVRATEMEAAGLVEDDISEAAFPERVIVRYHVQSTLIP